MFIYIIFASNQSSYIILKRVRIFIASPIKGNQQQNHIFVDDFVLALNHSQKNSQKITNSKK
jgi:hypothetical protein